MKLLNVSVPDLHALAVKEDIGDWKISDYDKDRKHLILTCQSKYPTDLAYNKTKKKEILAWGKSRDIKYGGPAK